MPSSASGVNNDVVSNKHQQREVKDQHYDTHTGAAHPAISMKWGRSPRNNHHFESDKQQQQQQQQQPKTTANADDKDKGEGDEPDWEKYYSPEEAAALRKRGINPALKAEMDHRTKSAEGRGFWVKLGQTAMGGGWIK